ncbi:MAG: hypothetical protein RMK90_06615 [Acetobacteraceae bacterium]|nr:hypothetical protein [Acetobacteraceae bacterium]
MAEAGRRALLLSPLLLAACAGGEEDAAPLPPLVEGYAHLTPLRLDVREIAISPPGIGPARRVDPPAPVDPLAEMERMARERLLAAGLSGRAEVAIEAASLTRQRIGDGGLFAAATERVACLLRCRVEVFPAEGPAAGFASAEVRRTASGPLDGSQSRRAAEIVRRAMEDMNVELEFQIRRNLRAFLVTGPPGPGVQAEPLPGA